MAKLGQGNFINGSFINEGNITLTSKNPSSNYESVFSVKTDISHVGIAIDAAKTAYKTWTYQKPESRINALYSLKRAFIQNESIIANAISLEMGKVYSEALTESKSLSARIDLMIDHGLKRVAQESLYDLRAETRYHNQGVLAVIGPYNFPAHLVNAHVIPSILLGNTVVIKPSEICPMVAETYAQCVMQSDLPKGVVNIVHGDGNTGKALCVHEEIDGVLFTGSYATGRALKELLIDQPQKILALEMGGKNFAVIMDDADLRQASLEIILGAFLTTGQRCTATSRVLVHDKVFDQFRDLLIKIARDLKPCKSLENGLFGPMATNIALDRFMSLLGKAKQEGAEVLVESEPMPGGAFVTPSVYQVRKNQPLGQYLGQELFGPNIALENFSNLDEAILRVNQSPYGLSNAIFTLDPKNSDKMIKETKSGVLNINRSTNNSLGQMPFGGLKRSGNQRPAGIDAVRYATFPMAIASFAYGESQASKDLKTKAMHLYEDKTPLSIIALRHEIESIFEIYGIYSDAVASHLICFNRSSFDGIKEESFFNALVKVFNDAMVIDKDFITIDLFKISDTKKVLSLLTETLLFYASGIGLTLRKIKTLAINVPRNLEIPRSRMMLDRLYRHNFVPIEKKSLVVDLERSRGAFLVSVDDDPLILFDAASQIATLGAGFLADTFQNAYDCNQFDLALMQNYDLSQGNDDENSSFYTDARIAKENFENFLHEKSQGRFKSVAYGASGAEANEIAFDLARLNGPGGTRIIAFLGSFHGRTIMALQATYNKEKRGAFVFADYEATFLPFPDLKDPQNQPLISKDILKSLGQGIIPNIVGSDNLLKEELNTLSLLKEEIAKGNICAVIIEPMQCEGGDKYATNRFFCGLRALTRALKIPLIFDEVQTGFNLGRTFFWYQQFDLVDHEGRKEIPDCITLAKKAQLGVCMSVWPNHRKYSPHIIQLKRGLLHGQAIDNKSTPELENKILKELLHLQQYFPQLVKNVRVCGFAFAFDMPTKELAMELIDQRFLRGFMAYIAGENTLRFRLNTVTSDDLLRTLFEKIFVALIDIRDQQLVEKVVNKSRGSEKKASIENVEFKELNANNFATYEATMDRIEKNAYEEGRRDELSYLLDWLKVKDSIGIIMTCKIDNKDIVAGYAIGGPLVHSKVDGAKDDPNRDKDNTFYSANITLDERVRGLGLGSLLKNEQIKRVSAMKNIDKRPRYLFMTGRNRVGLAPAMTQINENLSAYLVNIYDNQYNEKGAKAAYYRLPIAKSHHDAVLLKKSTVLDCRNTIDNPLANVSSSFMDALSSNKLRAIVGSKLTLSNWATPSVIRYSEIVRALMPKDLKHNYFTSGRDEVLDKGLRSLRFHRPNADIVIGFSHQWLGNITAAARSLSHDENQVKPFEFFNWPKIIHPGIQGNALSLKELKKVTSDIQADKVLGIVVELMGEKSGLTFDDDFLMELDAVRKITGIPLVFIENASSFYRSKKSLFLSDSLVVKANMVLWYTGGQLGHVFVDDNYFVEKPLTLISTWDGDEISMMRAYHNLLQAYENNWSSNISYFEQEMRSLDSKGMGAWHAIRLKDSEKLEKAINLGREHGILFGRGFDNSLMVCPKPDLFKDKLQRIIEVLQEILQK